jgi:hypothetical protein
MARIHKRARRWIGTCHLEPQAKDLLYRSARHNFHAPQGAVPFIAALVLIAGALCYGAYKIAVRSTVWPAILAPLLVFAAWRALLAPLIPQGEGAAIGVVVIQFGIWYLGGVCVLLALVLLGTSLYVHHSTAAAVILLCVVGPAVVALGYQLATPRGAASTTAVAPPGDSAGQRRNSYVEGSVWATDNGIVADSACHGSPAFIAGCKAAVLRHR